MSSLVWLSPLSALLQGQVVKGCLAISNHGENKTVNKLCWILKVTVIVLFYSWYSAHEVSWIQNLWRLKLYKQVTPQTEEQNVNNSFVVINSIKSLILKIYWSNEIYKGMGVSATNYEQQADCSANYLWKYVFHKYGSMFGIIYLPRWIFFA